MSRHYEDRCVGCTGMGLSCIGSACQYHGEFEVISCDKCGDSPEDIYEVDGQELCEECVLKIIPKYAVGEDEEIECDCCGNETDELYEYNGERLCEYCLMESFEKIRE